MCACVRLVVGSGMTGTRELHSRLLDQFEPVLTLPLPCVPLTRIALHLFRRRPRAAPAGRRGVAAAKLGMACAVCGAARGLRACPWTRRLLVCSERCHAASAAKHEASISWLYCGAKLPVGKRPKLNEFHPGAEVHLEEKAASDAEWLRLAQATPQPERELPP